MKNCDYCRKETTSLMCEACLELVVKSEISKRLDTENELKKVVAENTDLKLRIKNLEYDLEYYSKRNKNEVKS